MWYESQHRIVRAILITARSETTVNAILTKTPSKVERVREKSMIMLSVVFE